MSIVQATLSVHLSTPDTRRSRDKQPFRARAVQNPVQFRKCAPNAASQPACSRLSRAASRVHIGNDGFDSVTQQVGQVSENAQPEPVYLTDRRDPPLPRRSGGRA